MPSHETQAGTLWPTLALTAAYAEDERGRASGTVRSSRAWKPRTARPEASLRSLPHITNTPRTPGG